MKIKIRLPYEEQPITLGATPPKVSLSMPFLESVPYEPLFADHQRNLEWLAKNKSTSILVGKAPHNESLYYYENKKTGAFYYYTFEDDLVTYAVRCSLVDVPNIGRAVCQTSLWRDIDNFSTLSIPSWVFFNKLIPDYGMILSDKSQSRDGKAFWIRRIGEAFRKGLYVYIVDTRKNKVKVHSAPVTEFQASYARRLWSTTDQDFQNIRILITSREVPNA